LAVNTCGWTFTNWRRVMPDTPLKADIQIILIRVSAFNISLASLTALLSFSIYGFTASSDFKQI